MTVEEGERSGEEKTKGLELAKTTSKNKNKNSLSDQAAAMISKAYATTEARVNQDENAQLGMLLAPHATLTSLSRAYKLSPMTLKQLHEGLVKREPTAVADEVHTTLIKF